MFCVFSGQGVLGLRRYLNSEHDFADIRDPLPGEVRHRAGHTIFGPGPNVVPLPHTHNQGDGAFDDGEPDVVDDDDGLEDGSEMAIDTQPLLGPLPGLGTGGHVPAAPPVPPPPPQLPFLSAHTHQHTGLTQLGSGHSQPSLTGAMIPRILGPEEEDGDDAMDTSPLVASTSDASIAALGPHRYPTRQSSTSRLASGARSVPVQPGPSTASVPGPRPGSTTPPSLSGAAEHESLGPGETHESNSGRT